MRGSHMFIVVAKLYRAGLVCVQFRFFLWRSGSEIKTKQKQQQQKK